MLPVLVMVAASSRFIVAVMLPSRHMTDLVAEIWQLSSGGFTAVPHELCRDYKARHRAPWPAHRAGDGIDGLARITDGAAQAGRVSLTV